ncbi:MAG: ImcF-related family protein, partial [Rhodanobacter sp.]
EGYVQSAIRDAANNELNATDWVLQTTQQTDLTLSGSPEQIQKQLEALYDKDYVYEWQKFLQSVSVSPFSTFASAVDDMNTLGDPQNSPMRKLVEEVYRQTSWDNPSLVNQGLKSAQGGFTGWFKRVILRRQPAGLNANLDNPKGADGTLRSGPVGSAFAGVARLMVARDNNPALLSNYLDMLAKLRTRLNAIKNQGDAGPGARELMQQTLSNNGSELSSGLQLVDEQMLDGLDDRQRNTLRPLLLRPLIQTFNALITPTESEINKIWRAQVYTPFESNLAQKYPFDSNGQVQAADTEIMQVFGPSGAIAKFTGDTLGPLVDRRGDTLTAKQWADMGITLSPTLMTSLAQWVAPLGQTTGGGGSQTIFKIQPEPGSGGISEYTININGQSLRYRNTPPQWKPFVWDGSQANPMAQISAVTYDGRTVMIENINGSDALRKLFLAAKGTKDEDGVYTLTWSRDGVAVTVRLQVVSGEQTNADGSQKQGLQGTTLPSTVSGSSNAIDSASPATEAAQ